MPVQVDSVSTTSHWPLGRQQATGGISEAVAVPVNAAATATTRRQEARDAARRMGWRPARSVA
jgi:hypothetical protein